MKISRACILGSIFTLLTACIIETPSPRPPNSALIYAVTETDPVNSSGDAADDPAIWIHPENPLQSLIIGTDKRSGIEVYDLQGNRVQFIAAGLTNNVDLRMLSDAGPWSAIVAASNRSSNTVSLFVMDREGELTWLRDSEIDTGLNEPYGICMFRNEVGVQVFVNGTDGRFQQWGLTEEPGNGSSDPLRYRANLLREFSVPSQPEGCVADDAEQRLFLGVELNGIRVMPAHHAQPADIQSVMDIEGVVLAADVEGMSLYQDGDTGYLVVSSQGNFSFAVFDRQPPFAYRGSFVVADRADERMDGAQETDGLAVSSVALGTDYPAGLLVVQDGFNSMPRARQNFKYVSWQDVAVALGL